MAFNFNWSPLIADTDRVRDMLTSSLNKSPKPPIIVDDIVVNELNLGSTPPELEILEIGDLAEDRFRGIFKMSYTGDAYLTLKTRVQANPLNTYLSTKPSFTSPMPLAASSGLTIPVQITLSEIRLSGFVILVFSKQKGITLVFRNDPLESLKVSSTFDSIPFIKDYLQKTIESQLRVLFMEDLPAIIHRLSLQLFDDESQSLEQIRRAVDSARLPIDPFASPAQQPVDSSGMPYDGDMGFSLDTPTETYATFSQMNILRLAALSESQRTLSLFTPSIQDTVYRAWASAGDRSEANSGANTPLYPRPTTLSRIQSSLNMQSGWSSASSQVSDGASQSSRPSMTTMSSGPTVYSLNSGRPRTQRKRKNRVVNLRKPKAETDNTDVASVSSGYTDSASRTHSGSATHSVVETLPSSVTREGEINTPPRSPKKKVEFRPVEDSPLRRESSARSRPCTPRNNHVQHMMEEDNDETPRASTILPPPTKEKETEKETPKRKALPRMQSMPTRPRSMEHVRSASELNLHTLGAAFTEGSSGGILEQAWMMKMATEIARKVAEEKAQNGGNWRRNSDHGYSTSEDAPPAYVS